MHGIGVHIIVDILSGIVVNCATIVLYRQGLCQILSQFFVPKLSFEGVREELYFHKSLELLQKML